MAGLRAVGEDDEEAGEAGQDGRAAEIIGVLGAGTMGAGIAQLACRSGAQTLLYDPIAAGAREGARAGRRTGCAAKRRAAS